jgi:hypothetical protein
MLSDKNLRLERLKSLVEDIYGFNLSGGGRKREYVYAKKVYAKIAMDQGHTSASIGRSLNYNHATVLFYYKTFHSVKPSDIEIYERIIEIYEKVSDIKDENLSIKVKAKNGSKLIKAKYEILISELRSKINILEINSKKEENNKKVLDMMSGWTEDERSDFIEYRLKPYSKSIENRVFR